MPLHLLRRLGFALSFCVQLAFSPGLRGGEPELPEPADTVAGEDSEAGSDQSTIDTAAAYSIEALAPTLPTPEAAFVFVRNQIAYEPYAGVMKGAAGTLLTRGGNHWDRALLLQALLAAQGVEAQLVVGTLSEKEAGRRFALVTKQAAAMKLVLGSLPAASRREGANAKRQMVRANLQQRMDRRAAELKALEAVPLEWIDPATRGLEPKLFTAPRELVWVQAQLDGQSVALDPSLPTTKVGDVPIIEGEISEWAEPPAEASHCLTVRLALENLAPEGGLQRRDLLERSFVASSLQSTGLRLALLPRTAGKAAGNFRWQLFAGTEESESGSFRLTGEPLDDDVGGGEPVGFGGMFGGGDEEEPAPESAGETVDTGSRLARLFVEFVLQSPGLPDETFRRTIIDRVEPAGDGWRLVPGLADDRAVRPMLVQIWDAALDCGAPHPLAVREAQMAAMKALDPMLLSAKAHMKIEASDVGPPAAAPTLQSYFLASGLRRQSLCAAVGPEARSYALRPRLALVRHGAELADWTRPGVAAPRYREGIDLVNTPYRFLGAGKLATELARQAGVADTALEVRALGKPAVMNTLPVFAAARGQKLKLLVVTNPGGLRERKLPPAVNAALVGELRAGRRLVLTESPVAYAGSHVFAWWSVDSESGYAIGRMELGGGQGLAEVSKTHEQVGEWTEIFAKFYGGILDCYMTELGNALGSVDVDYMNLEVGVTINRGDPGETPLPAVDQLIDCVVGAACDAIEELVTTQISAAIAAGEAETLRDMIMEWLTDQAVEETGNAVNEACQKALLGGGAE